MQSPSVATSGPARRASRATIAIALSAGVACAAAAPALAGGGGGIGGGGGVGTPPAPRVGDVACAAKCAGLRSGVVGSKVAIRGKHLSQIRKVQFEGRKHRVTVRPDSRSKSALKATIPEGSKTGTVRVVDAYRQHATSSKKVRVLRHLPPASTFKLLKASAGPKKAFFRAGQSPSLTYLFSARKAVDLRIDVVREGTGGDIVSSKVKRNVKPNSGQKFTWDGLNDKRRPAPNGAYRFRITPLNGGGTETDRDARFRFFQYRFPLPHGHHTYGDGIGAGRGHEGQDIMTKCGNKIVAAGGGKVYFRKYQAGGAGNYVVINTYGGRSMVYDHLLHPAVVHKGQHVHTGQKLGLVGRTGDATACHLHFELWSKPGWFQGGHFTNPTDDLKRWDKWS